MADRKGVSLSDELHHVIRTVNGARELAERLGDVMFEHDAAVWSIVSTLVLVKERLLLLDRAVRGAVDPKVLWCRENQARDPVHEADDSESDIVLKVWSERKAVRRLRKDLRMAKGRLRQSRER